MDRRYLGCALFLIVCLLGLESGWSQSPIPIAELQRSSDVSFENEILPIFRKHCLACHGAGEKEGELLLETANDLLKGGDSGPAVVPGKSDESLLLKLATHQEEPYMPPLKNEVAASPLSSNELGLIKLWIQQGAKSSQTTAVLSPKVWHPLPPGVNAIHAAVVTSDGQFAACTRANQIFIYHVPTGALVTRLTDPGLQERTGDPRGGIAHLDVVQSLAFNDQGDLLASGAFREVKLWRRPRDVQQLQLAGAGAVEAMAISGDRKWLATASAADHVIKLWNLPSGQPAGSCSGHKDKVTSLVFLPSSQQLVSSSLDQTLCLWNAADGKLLGKIETPAANNAVEWVARQLPLPDPLSHDNLLLVSGGTDNLLRTWSLPQSVPSKIETVPADATRLDISGDGKLIAVGTEAGVITIVDSQENKVIASWKLPAALTSLSLRQAPAGDTGAQILLAAGADNALRLLDVTAANEVDVLWPNFLVPKSAAISADGNWIAAGYETGGIWLANRQTPAVEPFALAHNSAGPAALSSSRKKLALADESSGSGVALVDLDSRHVAQRIVTGQAVRALAIAADESRLATALADGSVRVWDLRATPPTEIVQLPASGAELTACGFAADANQLLTGAINGNVRIWNLLDSTFKECVGHAAAIVMVGHSANQPFSVSDDKSIRFWNPADGQLIRQFNDPATIVRAALNADATRLAIAGDDRVVRVYDMGSGGLLATLPASPTPVVQLHFSADSTRLCATTDGQVIVWDIATMMPLERLPAADLVAGYFESQNDRVLLATKTNLRRQPLRFQRWLKDITQPITDLQFQPDGQMLFASSTDGTLRGYRTSDGQSPLATNHGSAIHDIAISHNGQWLLSAGENAQLRVWQTGNLAPAPAQPATSFRGPIKAAAWTLDDTKIIGGSTGAPVEQLVFDVNSGQVLQRFTEHTSAATALAAANVKGERILSLAPGDGMRSWSISSAKAFAGHGQPITALAGVRTAALQVFSGSVDTTIRRWNLDNGQQLQQFNHGAAVTSIAIRPDGLRLVAAGGLNAARLWNAENGQQIAELRGDIRARSQVTRWNQQVQTLTARTNQAKQRMDLADQLLPTRTAAEKTAADALAAANAMVTEKTAAVKATMETKVAQEKVAIEAAAAAQRATMAKEEAEKRAMQLALAAQQAQERASRLATAAQNNTADANLAAAATAAQNEATQQAAQAQEAAAAVPAATQAAAQATQTANDAAAKVVEVQKPYNDAVAALKLAEMAQNLASQQHAVAARELQAAQAESPAAKEAFAAAEAALNQAKTQLDAANQTATAAELPIWSASFSPDGRLLATAGQFSNVHTWDSETGAAVAAYLGHTAAVRSAQFADDQRLVSAADDQSTIIWEVNPDWQLLRTIGSVDDPSLFAHRVLAVDFSRDGQLLATGGGIPSRRGEVHVFQVEDGKLLQHIPEAHLDTVFGVRFSPDGRRLASGGADKYVRTFDVTSGQQLRRMEGHTNYVLSVAWKSDGQLLASAAADMSIKVWNPETGDQLQTISGFVKPVTSVRFIGDTDNVVSASGDRIVRMHNALNAGNFRNFSGPTGYLHTIDITPGSEILVSGGQDSSLWIWDGNNGQMKWSLTVSQP